MSEKPRIHLILARLQNRPGLEPSLPNEALWIIDVLIEVSQRDGLQTNTHYFIGRLVQTTRGFKEKSLLGQTMQETGAVYDDHTGPVGQRR